MIPQTRPLSLLEALGAARETRELKIGRGILDCTPQVFRQLFGERPAVIVADPNTMAAARRAGAFGVLVLTGEATAADAAGSPSTPDLIATDIAEFGNKLAESRGRSFRQS